MSRRPNVGWFPGEVNLDHRIGGHRCVQAWPELNQGVVADIDFTVVSLGLDRFFDYIREILPIGIVTTEPPSNARVCPGSWMHTKR